MTNQPTEAQEQRTVVAYCDLKKIPCFHIPNGGSRDAREARNLKLQGVKPGVPDLFVPLARSGFHGLFIEMKRRNGGRVSEKQAEWIERLQAENYAAVVCHGADEAINAIELYMRRRTNA